MKNTGFTLIELVIYMALFSIMMGGLIVTIFQLIQNSEKINSKDSVHEEINFVFRKIDWALNDAVDISYPIPGSQNEIWINKNNFANNPIIFRLNDTSSDYKYIEFCVEETDCSPITTRNVKVEDMVFILLNDTNSIPTGVEIIVKIGGIKLSNTKYLKR